MGGRGLTMPVYMIIEIEVVDKEIYTEYMEKVPATVEKYGGRYIVRGGAVTPLTGGWRPERMIVLEFPSAEQMQRWNFSPEYLELAPLRIRSAKTRAIAVEGCSIEDR
jgi:uncharacterized protein (DUF1330 family)